MAVAKAYAAGGSLGSIAKVIGRSHPWVKLLLQEAGVELRSHGWAHPGTRPSVDGHVTAYVENTLRNRMADGTYKVGTSIPSTHALKLELGVSAGPVDRAVQRLAAAGFVLRVVGWGTVVTDPENPPEGPEIRVQVEPGLYKTWTVHEAGRRNCLLAAVTARIAEGTYAAGNRIPDRSAFVEEFNLSYPNVYYALKTLEERGILVAVGRKGLFVHPQEAPEAATKAAP
ncbi:GntR family transcriptional regulator [Streptomyces sp. NPDC048251]|uniref:GntR family transcriptional regulator n=1 Tax=Streptomyces sp. NPDC048251 TaxID=3154501 RepID=UPI00341F6BD3